MLHIATSHSISSRWIEIQTRHLREYVAVPFQTWASVPKEDHGGGARFDHLIAQKGPEASKLNHLAVEICEQAEEDDLLMFLSPDSFPIADPMGVVQEGLSRAPLIAVRRIENDGERQPYPCFCVSTVGTWRRLAGDWSDGYPWSGSDGVKRTEIGSNLLRRLELTGTPWAELHRSNPARHDPLYFAIYGGVVYHHGSGEIARVHRASQPKPIPVPPLPGIAGAVRRLGDERRVMWERGLHKRFARQSDAIVERIEAGGSGWLAEVS
jgi:hypothetical protein